MGKPKSERFHLLPKELVKATMELRNMKKKVLLNITDFGMIWEKSFQCCMILTVELIIMYNRKSLLIHIPMYG